MILKIVHGINYGLAAITIVWYFAAGYEALTIQFFMGCYQLITALVLSILFRKFETKQVITLLIYWALTVIWVLLAMFFDNLKPEIFASVILIWLPIFISAYFVYVTYVFSSKPNHHEP
jgi:hypothetical protein